MAKYNVYRAPDGCAEEFLGEASSLREARRMAAHGARGLEASLYGTARAAGHVNGDRAPDKAHEADEPAACFGRNGWYYAVEILKRSAEPPVPREDERADYDVYA